MRNVSRCRLPIQVGTKFPSSLSNLRKSSTLMRTRSSACFVNLQSLTYITCVFAYTAMIPDDTWYDELEPVDIEATDEDAEPNRGFSR